MFKSLPDQTYLFEANQSSNLIALVKQFVSVFLAGLLWMSILLSARFLSVHLLTIRVTFLLDMVVTFDSSWYSKCRHNAVIEK